ncbi:MAG: hypothetical protein LBJ94_04160 [Puniceicoccales bacterium]|nr:hypothetical protein [Puniceicoccales bacterium]
MSVVIVTGETTLLTTYFNAGTTLLPMSVVSVKQSRATKPMPPPRSVPLRNDRTLVPEVTLLSSKLECSTSGVGGKTLGWAAGELCCEILGAEVLFLCGG